MYLVPKMKVIFGLLVVLVLATTINADLPCSARVYCGRVLAKTMHVMCSDDDYLDGPKHGRQKRNPIWPVTPRVVQVYEYGTHSKTSTTSTITSTTTISTTTDKPTSVVEECCYKPCCIDQMLKYCDRLFHRSD